MVWCTECGTEDDFDYGDGTGYCRVCGTQSQDIREEVVELDETMFSQHNSTRRIAQDLNSTKNTKPERIWSVPEAVQTILQIQIDSLINLVGAPKHLRQVAGNLWFRLLTKVGILTLPGVDPVVLTMPHKISIYDNLTIIYLSLLAIEYPVVIADILNWICNGTLCYFNTNKLLPGHFRPLKLLHDSLRVSKLPSLAHLYKRTQLMCEILDDIPRPVIKFSLIDEQFNKLESRFKVTTQDVHEVCLGLYKKLNSSWIGDIPVPPNLEVTLGACFVTALRLYYQFENPSWPKSAWLQWYIPYLQSRHKHKIVNIVGKSVASQHHYVTEKHFLNMSVDEYLRAAGALISQNATVMKTANLTNELEFQFSDLLGQKWKDLILPDAIARREPKGSGKQRYRKKIRLECKREILVYTLDNIQEDSILPLELEIILDDVAGYFHITCSELFCEIQRQAREIFNSK